MGGGLHSTGGTLALTLRETGSFWRKPLERPTMTCPDSPLKGHAQVPRVACPLCREGSSHACAATAGARPSLSSSNTELLQEPAVPLLRAHPEGLRSGRRHVPVYLWSRQQQVAPAPVSVDGSRAPPAPAGYGSAPDRKEGLRRATARGDHEHRTLSEETARCLVPFLRGVQERPIPGDREQ